MVVNSVSLCKATMGHRGANSLRTQLDTEEFIFRQFVRDLLSSDVADADLVQISDSSKPNTSFWKNRVLHSKLETRLGPDGTKIVLSSLEEMDKLLTSLRDKFASINAADPVSTHFLSNLIFS